MNDRRIVVKQLLYIKMNVLSKSSQNFKIFFRIFGQYFESLL